MTPIEIIGYVLLALIGFTLVAVLVRQVAAVRHEARREAAELELLDTRIRSVRIARERADLASGPWDGWRKFRVDRKVHEGGDICSFYLVPHDRKPLPLYKPGQYLTFEFHGIPETAKPEIRCYSLSDAFCPEYYRISVKRVPPPPDAPDAPPGRASNFLHDHVEEGALLDVGAPHGNFVVDPADSTPLVLVGGGIGVTPVLSMFNAILEAESPREVWFFYGVRNPSENILKAQFEDLNDRSADLPNVHFFVCYSEGLGPGVELNSFEKDKTRVTADLLRSLLPSNNYSFFTCGPPAMMKAIKEGLREWGVPPGDINEEVFPAPKYVPPKPPPGAESAGTEGICVEFRKAGQKVETPAECATLLDLAEGNGVEIPFACRVGSCGSCVTAVLEGMVEYVQEPSWKDENELEQEGLCLPCICVPKSELVVDQ